MLKFGILIFIFSSIGLQNLHSQFYIENYVDVGKTNVSEGIYSNYALIVSAKQQSYRFSTGALATFSNTDQPIFSGYKFSASKDLKLKAKSYNLALSYLILPFSSNLREHDFVLLASFQKKKMDYSVGFNSRLYTFSNAAKVRYAFAPGTDTNIWEPLNLMYKVSFNQAFNNDLNLELRLTNFDNFYILQETNPMILAKLCYKLNKNLQLYSNISYLQAGLFNMRVNYFGYYFRGGLVWEIN